MNVSKNANELYTILTATLDTVPDNYGGVAWTYGLECYGNETVLDQCHFPNKWKLDSYTNKTDWGYRHGTWLFCVGK
jgi:hypothetical protein